MKNIKKGAVTANNSPVRIVRALKTPCGPPFIEVYQMNTCKSPSDTLFAARQLEMSKIPRIKAVKNERKIIDALRIQEKVSEKINKNAFSPIMREAVPFENFSASINHKQAGIEDSLRRTFRRTMSYSNRNMVYVRQSTANLQAHSEPKSKYEIKVHGRASSLPKISVASSVGVDMQKGNPLEKYRERIVHSIVKKRCVYFRSCPISI